MRVLTWNLFHGRAVPDVPRALHDEFGSALVGWDWDVALLQECPPWWPPLLGRRCGAHARWALTSRNLGLPLRRWVADRRPDLIKSNGGGCNAILVRGPRPREHRTRRLRWCPERRVLHAVRLLDGTWVGNVHAQVRPHEQTYADVRLAGETLLAWAGPDAPVLLGGDLNVRDPERTAPAALVRVPGTRGVDHVLARGFAIAPARARALDGGGLSDHAPVLAEVGR